MLRENVRRLTKAEACARIMDMLREREDRSRYIIAPPEERPEDLGDDIPEIRMARERRYE